MAFLPNYCENIPRPFCRVTKEFHHGLPLRVDTLDELTPDFWNQLSANPSAIFLLKCFPEKINWTRLSSNPSAIDLLEKHPDRIDFQSLSSNPNAVHLLKRNLDKVDWEWLSNNPGAISILKAYPHKIHWTYLSSNPNAYELIRNNLEKISWIVLSSNPCAVPILRCNMDKIHWGELSRNESEAAMDLLEEYPDKIHWPGLCRNPYAMRFLLQPSAHISREIYANPLAYRYLPHKFEEDPSDIPFSIVTYNPRLGDVLHYYPFDDTVDDDPDNLIWIVSHPDIFEDIWVEYDYEGIEEAFRDLHAELRWRVTPYDPPFLGVSAL